MRTALLLMLLLGLASCETSPSVKYNLTPEEIEKNTELAYAGSTDAAAKLAFYYDSVGYDEKKFMYWCRRSAQLGHRTFQDIYFSHLVRIVEEGKPVNHADLDLAIRSGLSMKAIYSNNQDITADLEKLQRAKHTATPPLKPGLMR